MRISSLVLLFLVLPVFASAHVSVRPPEVGVSAYQTFNVSVPTEKEIATVGVRLIIPEGLESVKPNVKAGWNIEIVKTGEGELERVSEIVWAGGAIPADQRDDFFFSAKTPAGATTLHWKAYQTYEDGTIVAWDAEETGHDDAGGEEEEDESRGPQSSTRVINDLATEDGHDDEEETPAIALEPVLPAEMPIAPQDPWTVVALILAGVALALGIRSTFHQNHSRPIKE